MKNTNQVLNREEIISFLRSNKKFLEHEFNVSKIGLFGSYARNEARPESDIDIIIDMDDTCFLKLVLLKDFLEDNFKKEVNVVTFDGVRTFIKRRIQRDIIYA